MILKNVERKEKNVAVLTVEVPAADFNAACEKIYRKMKNRLSVPGFRKGKAPRKLIEKLYGADVFYEDAVNEVYPDAIEDAIKESGLEVVGYPDVKVDSIGADGFSFTATVGVKPEVKLGEYKGVSAMKETVVVTDEDVENEMQPLVSRATVEAAVTDRAVAEGDIAVIDFEGFKDGVAFEGGKGENYSLEIGSNTFIPGFEEQVVGMNVGEEKALNVTFPENYGAEELAGAAVVFNVKVNEIKTKVAPAIDDDFAQDVSEFQTLEELKADLRAKVEERKAKAAQDAFETSVMNKVIENCEMEVPDTMVEYELDKQMQNTENQMKAYGMTLDQYLGMMGTNRQEYRDNMRLSAENNIKHDLVVEAVMNAEGVEASDEEIEAEVARLAEEYGMDAEQIKKSISNDQLAYGVKMDKARKIITESAVVEG